MYLSYFTQQNLACISEGSLKNNLMSYVHYSKSFYRNLSEAASHSISAAYFFSTAKAHKGTNKKFTNKQTKNLATRPQTNSFTEKNRLK